MRVRRRVVGILVRVAGFALSLALAGPCPQAAATVTDGIAAVVNGEVITLLDVKKAGRAALEERLRAASAGDQERVRREVLGAVLEEMVVARIQVQRARKAGIQVSASEVDDAIASIRAEQKVTEAELIVLLQERGVTQEGYRRDIADQLRISKLLQLEIRARVAATDAEIAAWFEEHRQQWHRPEKIRIRHLLVRLPHDPSLDDIEKARARGYLLRGLPPPGTDFAVLARAEKPGAGDDADLVAGEIARGELFPALDEAAFALPVGGICEPVRSPAGFHLVQVTEKTPAYEPRLEDVRDEIERRIVERKARERYNSWIRQIRGEAIVEIRF